MRVHNSFKFELIKIFDLKGIIVIMKNKSIRIMILFGLSYLFLLIGVLLIMLRINFFGNMLVSFALSLNFINSTTSIIYKIILDKKIIKNLKIIILFCLSCLLAIFGFFIIINNKYYSMYFFGGIIFSVSGVILNILTSIIIFKNTEGRNK